MNTRIIKELTERLCDINNIISQAKKQKDETGENPLPYKVYCQLCEERRNIRKQLTEM